MVFPTSVGVFPSANAVKMMLMGLPHVRGGVSLSVGGSLYLDAKRISNIAIRENCGYSSRTIFAAWCDNNFKIAAGCFFDTLDKFEQAVDEKYSGSAAEAYKQAGRDCVAELTVKLNKEAA